MNRPMLTHPRCKTCFIAHSIKRKGASGGRRPPHQGKSAPLSHPHKGRPKAVAEEWTRHARVVVTAPAPSPGPSTVARGATDTCRVAGLLGGINAVRNPHSHHLSRVGLEKAPF